VREFVEEAFSSIDVQLTWEGKGLDEIAKDRNTGTILVKVNAELFRPNDIPMLCGSSRKAEKELGWSATIGFKELVQDMVQSDVELLRSTRSGDRITANILS